LELRGEVVQQDTRLRLTGAERERAVGHKLADTLYGFKERGADARLELEERVQGRAEVK
jgi:hypothetical protein